MTPNVSQPTLDKIEHLRYLDSVARYKRWLLFLSTSGVDRISKFIWEKKFKPKRLDQGAIKIDKKYKLLQEVMWDEEFYSER